MSLQPTDIEKENLESHVELCALRYQSLENTLKQTMDSMLKEELDGGNYDNLTYILEQIKSFILTFTKIL